MLALPCGFGTKSWASSLLENLRWVPTNSPAASAHAFHDCHRAALLSHALSHDPSLLLEATDDRLHQRQRHSVYPESLGLVGSLRKRGIAAAISGAGPTVIVLGSDDAGEIARNIGDLAGPSWRVLALRVAGDGVRAA